MKKYKLTNEAIQYQGKTLYRIKALKDFSNVTKGDLGGYVESESNLSHDDTCWVYYNAKVYDNAKVYGNSMVYGNAIVYGNSVVCGNSMVYGSATVYGNSVVYGNSRISKNMKVSKRESIFHTSNLKHNLTVTLIGINIGCKHYIDLEDFLSKCDKDAKDNGYSELELSMLKTIVKNAMEYLKLQNK